MALKTSLSFVTWRELNVICECEEFEVFFVLVSSTFGPTLRSLTTTALSTQICCVYELKLNFFIFGHHD